eukprot:1161635-Pelagomonas_calceolata.AAC.15
MGRGALLSCCGQAALGPEPVAHCGRCSKQAEALGGKLRLFQAPIWCFFGVRERQLCHGLGSSHASICAWSLFAVPADFRTKHFTRSCTIRWHALTYAHARTDLYTCTGDLGAIDAKYDVAVSTAVGALDYIVVETTSDAQRCVEYLRKHNLGVATFLILEKQKHLAAAAAQRVQTPEGDWYP